MILTNILLPILALTVAYGLVSAGLVWLLRWVGVPARGAILLACLTVGLAAGLLSAWVWPLDSSVLFNVYATLLGDVVYGLAWAHLGDPWLLRVPQVYLVASVVLWGAVGCLVQALFNRRA